MKGAGAKGDVACWSFQAVKTLPAGDGGMVTTNNRKIAEKIKRMSWNGIGRSTWDRSRGKRYTWDYKIHGIGWKYYMNDLTAAIVLAQLKKLKKNIERRKRIAGIYTEKLEKHLMPAPSSGTYQYYVVRTKQRDRMADYLSTKGIATSVHFKPLHLYDFFKDNHTSSFPVANRVWKEFLSLPIHTALTSEDVYYIIRCLKEAIFKFKVKNNK